MGNRKLLGFLLTPVFLFSFGATLILFHPLLVIAKTFFGYKAFRAILELMNRAILFDLRLVGTSYSFSLPYKLPADRPLIIVSNHQSMYDIPLLIVNFGGFYPTFIAKTELARGIPSISYSLRAMEAAIIDRSDHKQALRAIEELAERLNHSQHAVCIFPEGTRARDGKIKKFKHAGLVSLINAMPKALIVPIVINGSWELLRYNFNPVPFGTQVSLTMLEPIEIAGRSARELSRKVEETIRNKLGEFSAKDAPG